TGGRLKRVAPLLEHGTFCATYADGVADIDLHALIDFHRAHGALATMTVVRPELQFGIAELDGDGIVTAFREKPRAGHWLPGGYGLLGAWLVRALLEAEARVTVLRRDKTALSALVLEGLEARVNVVDGDVCDAALMQRALGEYEVDTVFHLAAQTIVGTAKR